MNRLLAAALAAAVLAGSALVLGTTSAPARPTATILKLRADPGGALKYDKKTLTAKPGVVTIVMTNPSVIPHDIAIKGNGVKAKGKIVVKGVSKVTATLKKGVYTFYCSVPGHVAAGMKGKLIVK